MSRLSKVEKLRIAGAVAPVVRRGSNRKVTVVSKTGEPVRQMTLDEVQAALTKRQDIEFSVRNDAPQTVCAGWEGRCPDGASPGREAFKVSKVSRRNGEPWRCKRCANDKVNMSRTAERRSEIGRKARSAVSPDLAGKNRIPVERRSEMGRKLAAAAAEKRTTEERRETSRKMHAKKTAAHRSEIVRKAWATRRAKKGSK